MAKVVSLDELRFSPTAALFEGNDEINASIFVTRYEKQGEGPGLHVHPYPEAFVVEDGTAIFTSGEEQIEVGAGHVVVVPAETPHGFKNATDALLRVVSVHPSPTAIQTWL